MLVTWLWAFKNFKNDCVRLIFLQVFDVSCFILGGSEGSEQGEFFEIRGGATLLFTFYLSFIRRTSVSSR